jgi:cysteinyl-tRNA synthetase
MANYWMHNGFLQVEGEKMSKSVGNFVTIHELLAQQPNNRWWGEILRFNMLRSHYRQPIDWTQSSLSESVATYGNLQRAVARGDIKKAKPSDAVIGALSDDLNTPAAIAELHKLAAEARSTNGSPHDAATALLGSLQLLGFEKAIEHAQGEGAAGDIMRAIEEAKARERGLDPLSLDSKIEARNAARKSKNFKESDRIRDELAAMGVVLKDSKDGTTWEIAR